MTPKMAMLPPDLIEVQVAQIGLLLAMYADEISDHDRSAEAMETLTAYLQSEMQDKEPPPMPSNFQITIKLELTKSKRIQIEVSIPLKYEVHYEGQEMPTEMPYAKTRLIQPPWLSNSQVAAINAEVPDTFDWVARIEHIKEAAGAEATRSQEGRKAIASSSGKSSDPLVRVWFYFPSISTREKRDDLINNAPHYDLTGFLLAGKPGILCLEGTSKSIDDYMKFIKTESWGGIPAHHKKVSERYREESKGGHRGEDDIKRRFDGMTEVTDDVGERRGERGNRTDMKALEEWLKIREFEGILEKIVM